MDIDRARNPRQHGGGKQQSNDQLDPVHVRRRSPTWDATRAVIDRSPVDSWHANAAPTRLPGSPPRMLTPGPSARYRSARKRAAVTEELLASATGTPTVTPTSFLTDGTATCGERALSRCPARRPGACCGDRGVAQDLRLARSETRPPCLLGPCYRYTTCISVDTVDPESGRCRKDRSVRATSTGSWRARIASRSARETGPAIRTRAPKTALRRIQVGRA